MIISTIPDFSLQYDGPLGLLRVEWAPGADMKGLRASTEALCLLCGKLGARRWLMNMDTLPDISVYDQIWLGTHWLPNLLQLPLERVVLVNQCHRVHNQLAIEALLAVARPFMKFDVQYFPKSEAGLQWLSDYSDRLPGLLAEWNSRFGAVPLLGPDAPVPRVLHRPR